MAAKSPMLAERESCHLWPDELRFPVLAAPKLDGIRCGVIDAQALSRKYLPIANDHVRGLLSDAQFNGMDGELVVGPPAAENVYNVTCAVNGNKVPKPDFSFQVFDDFNRPDVLLLDRREILRSRVAELEPLFPFIKLVPSELIGSWDELANYESLMLEDGYEGVIVRSPSMPYKFGRSTKREQGMVKLKRFTDGEAQVIGFVELFHNTNENIKDAFGHAKRSKSQAGLVAGDTLGKFECRDLVTGVEFEIGMFKGLTLADKQEIWDNREKYLGKIVKYQHFAHGAIDKPRHSKFLGWRDPADM